MGDRRIQSCRIRIVSSVAPLRPKPHYHTTARRDWHCCPKRDMIRDKGDTSKCSEESQSITPPSLSYI